MRHRRGHAARQRLHEGKTGGDSVTLTGDERLTLHLVASFEACRASCVARRACSAEGQRQYQSESESKANPVACRSIANVTGAQAVSFVTCCVQACEIRWSANDRQIVDSLTASLCRIVDS